MPITVAALAPFTKAPPDGGRSDEPTGSNRLHRGSAYDVSSPVFGDISRRLLVRMVIRNCSEYLVGSGSKPSLAVRTELARSCGQDGRNRLDSIGSIRSFVCVVWAFWRLVADVRKTQVCLTAHQIEHRRPFLKSIDDSSSFPPSHGTSFARRCRRTEARETTPRPRLVKLSKLPLQG
jgi:hypothetical protein